MQLIITLQNHLTFSVELKGKREELMLKSSGAVVAPALLQTERKCDMVIGLIFYIHTHSAVCTSFY
jgi:hypothetical protein